MKVAHSWPIFQLFLAINFSASIFVTNYRCPVVLPSITFLCLYWDSILLKGFINEGTLATLVGMKSFFIDVFVVLSTFHHHPSLSFIVINFSAVITLTTFQNNSALILTILYIFYYRAGEINFGRPYGHSQLHRRSILEI